MLIFPGYVAIKKKQINLYVLMWKDFCDMILSEKKQTADQYVEYKFVFVKKEKAYSTMRTFICR